MGLTPRYTCPDCGDEIDIAVMPWRCECTHRRRPLVRATASTVAALVGSQFAAAHPDLRLKSGCAECLRIVNELDTGHVDYDRLARGIVHNANRTGLKKFGTTRSEQQAAIAKELRCLIDRPAPADVTIAAVHFNPFRYRRLRETYYEWTATLPMKPVCYELVFAGQQPEIKGSIVIRGDSQKNLLWQKEPLLNIALRDCQSQYFCWCDHDIVIDSKTWIQDAITTLETEAVNAVQCFNTIKYLDANGNTEKSFANRPGGCWIAKTETLRRLGGFPTDKIVGGGDDTMLSRMKPTAKLRVDAKHLYHGELSDRQYGARHVILKRHKFDVRKDIRINATGLLEWSTDKPDLHRDVAAFFRNRKDDGIDNLPTIRFITPWDHGKDIGRAYNTAMDAAGVGDWVCFLDGDAVQTHTFFGRNLAHVIQANPGYDLLTCYTNRVNCAWQILTGVDRTSNDMEYHRRLAIKQWNQHGTDCTDVTNLPPLSGVLILVSKRAWQRFGPFRSGMLGVDNDYHRAVKNAGGRVGRMNGVYVYHWYRGGDPRIKDHLL